MKMLWVFLALLIGVNFTATAAEYNVNNENDLPDYLPGDGICSYLAVVEQGGESCTLRAAIMEANASTEADTILLEGELYVIAFGTNEEEEDQGLYTDLDILSDMTIVGVEGSEITTLNAFNVFDVHGTKSKTLNVGFKNIKLYGVFGNAIQAKFASLSISALEGENFSDHLVAIEESELVVFDTVFGGKDKRTLNSNAIFSALNSKVRFENFKMTNINSFGDSLIEIFNSEFQFINSGIRDSSASSELIRLSGYAEHTEISNSWFKNNSQRVLNSTSNNKVLVDQSLFESNKSSTAGAAIYSKGKLIIYDSYFLQNASDSSGGALYIDGEGSLLERSSFNGNKAKNGGAIYSKNTLEVSNSTFFKNNATSNGGSLFHHGIQVRDQLKLKHVTIGCSGASSLGGVIYQTGKGRVTLQNSVVLNTDTCSQSSQMGDAEDISGMVDSIGHNAFGVSGVTEEWLSLNDIMVVANEDNAELDFEVISYESPNNGTYLIPNSSVVLNKTGLVGACKYLDQLKNYRLEEGGCRIGSVDMTSMPADIGQVSFLSVDGVIEVSEGENDFQLVVSRTTMSEESEENVGTGKLHGKLSVHIKADAGGDARIQFTPNKLTWNDNEQGEKYISLNVKDNNLRDFDGSVRLYLSTTDEELNWGINELKDNVVVTVKDDERLPGEFYAPISVSVTEGEDEFVSIFIERKNGMDGSVSVGYELYDVSQNDGAKAQFDYDPLLENENGERIGILSWEDQDSAPKEIRVRLINDADIEGKERFYVRLVNASEGTVINSRNYESIVYINSDDTKDLQTGELTPDIEETNQKGEAKKASSSDSKGGSLYCWLLLIILVVLRRSAMVR